MMFNDRVAAGRMLGRALSSYRGRNVVVYALPRGGVVLGAEVARSLEAPLDLIIVRKVGHPRSPEYAIAAVAEDGHILINRMETGPIDPAIFAAIVRREQQEAQRRRSLYCGGRAPVSATGKVAIIVDDGLATGLTMKAAVQEVRHSDPAQVVVAIPVAPPQAVEELRGLVDDVVALHVSSHFGSVGSFYMRFDQVSDEEVIELMASSNAEPQTSSGTSNSP